MTDVFEQQLQRTIDAIQKRIDAAEEAISTANDTISEATKQITTFRDLLDAYKEKKKNDCEALAEFYISDRKDKDIQDFSNATGIGLGDEQEAEEEGSKEAPETG